MEKQQFGESIRPATPVYGEEHEEESQHATNGPDWQPGFWARFPWIGFGALFMVLLCVAGSVIILYTSNGRSETHWPNQIAPNVLLSITNNVANICFGIAIGNGIAIAWWRKTLKGASIHELHRAWSFSTSLKDIVFSIRYFNIIALAALTAKLTIIDGTLMQKATTTDIRTDNPVTVPNISGFVNTSFPITGRVSSYHDPSPGLMSAWVSDDLKLWSQSGGLLRNKWQGCNGRCFLEIPAAGFAFDCEDPVTKSIEYYNTTMQVASLAQYHNGSLHQAHLHFTQPLFGITFDASYNGNSYLIMDLLYTQATDHTDNKGVYSCPGTLTKQTCKLRPAVISYPIQIENYGTTHAISGVKVGITEATYRNESTKDVPGAFNQALKQQNGYKVLRYIENTELHDSVTYSLDSHLAGISLGMTSYLGSDASVYQDFGIFAITQLGSAQQYLMHTPTESKCSFKYMDPLTADLELNVPSVISKINEMMFSIASDIAREDPSNHYAETKNYTASVYKDSIHYVSHFPYMWGAVASTLVCVLLVLPVYWGFWELGRKVTLGPFEIAHAFRSPMTADASNGTVEEVMKSVGDRQITYGHIVAGNARGVLGVAEPQYVEKLPQGPILHARTS